MLNVYLKREDIPQTLEIIDNNDIVFDYDLYNNLKVDTNVQKIMKAIDGAEYIQGLDMRSKFGNITSMENLSTGCKTMINILHHPNAVINCIECGDNVLHKILHMNVGNVLLPLLPSNSEDSINVSVKTNKGSLTIDNIKALLKFGVTYN